VSKSDDVRFTRDGDQFHYLWAARRCLKLLSPTTSLVAITVEGASNCEVPDGEHVAAGEEVIDVAEYYGSTSLAEATSVRYVQLKHSTVNSSEAWTMSGLSVTLGGFTKRFQELGKTSGIAAAVEKLTFVFATNRPISLDVSNAIEDARREVPSRNAQASQGLEKYTGLVGKELASFCALVTLESEHDGFLAQRTALTNDLRSYLAGGDSEAFLQIKELVTRKATSEYADNPSITKLDILRVLGRDEDDLFPAQNEISLPDLIIPRDGEQQLVQAILDASTSPIIVHAEGGVGKSVFASRIGLLLPPGSVTVVYDCFGNGQYRAPSQPRHGARQALVQIANEFASGGYCHPMIPSAQADDAAYFKAFRARIGQAVSSIQQLDKNALLCVVIDAADNAEMAAAESGDRESFARKLIRESFPIGVRLVMLCRTHRRHLLKPPSSTIEVGLPLFSWDETASKLRGVFPNSTDQDVHEFHRLSSQNPRVQATALGTASEVQEMLRSLGPEPKNVDDMIGLLLGKALRRVIEEVPSELRPKFDRICTALAVLRPMIPLAVMASLVQVDQDHLRSFLADLGQSVLIKGALLQFRDEPTETWFQEQFKPNQEALREFIGILRPQASKSAYVAATLPHLLLKAEQMDELIKIALSSSDLPDLNTLEKRDVEAQRLHFALRASLRCRRYLDATKLALAAAGLAAAEDRQWKTLQANTDLAGRFLPHEQILSLITGKVFAGGWRGAHHVYDASILSVVPGFHGDAQSHIRMAEEWIRNLQTLPLDQREEERIEASDIAALVFACLNIYGPERAASMIGRCRAVQFRQTVASLVAGRLIDAGRFSDLDAIAVGGAHDTVLVTTLVQESARVTHLLPKEGVQRAWKNVIRIEALDKVGHHDMEAQIPSVLTAFAWTAVKLKICTPELIATVMNRHLGGNRLRSLGYQHDRSAPTLIKAYLLKATLSGQTFALIDLAHPDWHEALKKGGHRADEREVRAFRGRAGALMPWYQLWADIVTFDNMPEEDALARILQAENESKRALQINYWDVPQLKNDIAIAHMEVLVALGEKASALIDSLRQRLSKNDYFPNTLIAIVWMAARCSSLKAFALEISGQVVVQLDSMHEQAESRADSLIALARALMTCHESESKYFFQKSIEVASKVGDENLWRWGAVAHLADAASSTDLSQPELAYRVARSAELTYQFVVRDKHFDWQGTVEAISNLCPSSAFAILSRWRDRGFGSCQRVLAIMVKHLASQKRLDAAVTAALYGFQAQWATSEIFSLVMENSKGKDERQNNADLLYQYIQLEQNSESTWEEIQEAAKKFQIVLPGIESYIQQERHQKQLAESRKEKNSKPAISSDTMNWEGVFNSLEITSLSGLEEAYQRFLRLRKYDSSTNFYEQAALRVPLGQEVIILHSLRDFPTFELFELRYFLQGVPAAWRKQFSTMSEVQLLVKTLIARHSLGVSRNRYYQTLPLDMVERATNLPVEDLIDVALEATAEISSQLNAESLFQLVGLLAKKLSEKEAGEALDFELAKLENSMVDGLGDGSWSEELLPPVDINCAVAGYVWGALAVPESGYRWQAAHVVRALCRLGCEVCIDSLMLWLNTASPVQFVDKDLVHYRLHAKLWLLIGLARAALDHPDILRKYIHSFVNLAVHSEEQHVLMRGFAARAVIAIGFSNSKELSPETIVRVRSINEPILSSNSPSRMQRLSERRTRTESTVELKLHFGIDMPSYWFDPLATRFGLSTSEICSRIQDTILNRFSTSTIQWDDDKRYRRNCYTHESTSHSHGSYPKSEDLHFYLSFHSMMTVAGELLATMPMAPPEHEDDDYDTFQYWLRGYELTRLDGRWLADGRDPEPFDYSDWSSEGDDQVWRCCIAKKDFSALLLLEPGVVAVSGRRLQRNGARRQEVSIRSALVSSESARALLVASQTASDFNWTASLPHAEDREEVSIAGFELTGWVLGKERNDGIDQHDPWCADIHFPPLAPSAFACQLLELATDQDGRHWYKGEDKALVMKSRTWGNPPADYRTEEESNYGLLLEASVSTLTELASKTGKSLVFKVSITRRLSSSYREEEDQLVKYPAPYILYFLLNDDETFTSL